MDTMDTITSTAVPLMAITAIPGPMDMGDTKASTSVHIIMMRTDPGIQREHRDITIADISPVIDNRASR
jgi:hypothetical protein